MRNTLIFIVAVFLFILFGIPGFLYGVVKGLFTKVYSDFIWWAAFSLDQTGNAFCCILFNDVLIKVKGPYLFGNPDETVSHVLGKNAQICNLTRLGRLIADILNFLDENHIEKAANRPQ